MRSHHRRHVAHGAIATAVAVFAALTGVSLRADDREYPDGLIQRVVAQTTRSGVAIRARREMRAGTVSGKHEGWMTVDTAVTPSGSFSWTVVSEGGSDRTRDKIFKELLENEAESMRDGSQDSAALTPTNYAFTLLPATRPGEVQIRLTPRREDPRLVDGILTVSRDGYPLRLEGKLAKSPSFWVKSVTVVKRYGRFAGVALPTFVESHADLKLIGESRFTMRYHYREVNGRLIGAPLTTAELGQ